MLPTIHAVFRDIPKFSRFPNVHNGRYGGHHHTKVPNRGRTSPMLVGRRGRRPGNDDALVKVLSPTGPLGTPFPTVLSAVGAPVALQTKHGVLDRPHLSVDATERGVDVGLHGVPEILRYEKIVQVPRRVRPARGLRPQYAANRSNERARFHHGDTRRQATTHGRFALQSGRTIQSNAPDIARRFGRLKD